MFTYIDPDVRRKLLEQGRLLRIDREGRLLSPDERGGGGSISILGPIPLPLTLENEHHEVQWFACVRNTELSKIQEIADDLVAQKAQQSFATLATSMAVNSVLVAGDPGGWKSPLVRVHSSCLTGDVFGSERCECGPQFSSALKLIDSDDEGGLLIYMSGHEGRGIGLWAKAATYLLQDGGEDTYQANRSLGLPDDSRDFSDAAALLKYFLGNKPFRLLTNNPKKLADLADAGLTGITAVKHVCGVSASNRRYLQAKQDWGHRITKDDISSK